VGELLATWLDGVKPAVRPNTFVFYELHVRLHLGRLAGIRSDRLTPAHVRQLVATLLDDGISPKSVGHTLTVLRMALRQAVADGVLTKNVAALVKSPRKPEPMMDTLTADEFSRLLTSVDDPQRRAMYAVAGGLGLRIGEVLGLSWSDVDGATLTVRQSLRPIPGQERGKRLQLVEPKTERSKRTLVMPRFVAHAIAQVPKRGPLVFTSRDGTPCDPRNVLRQFKADCAAAGLPSIRFHGLRHTAATLMLASGSVDLATVRDILGHSNIATTTMYAHVVPSMRQAAADTMDGVLASAG
jgi:integrase